MQLPSVCCQSLWNLHQEDLAGIAYVRGRLNVLNPKEMASQKNKGKTSHPK